MLTANAYRAKGALSSSSPLPTCLFSKYSGLLLLLKKNGNSKESSRGLASTTTTTTASETTQSTPHPHDPLQTTAYYNNINSNTQATASTCTTTDTNLNILSSPSDPSLPHALPRLESHYYSTLLPNLMILNYNHASPHATRDYIESLFRSVNSPDYDAGRFMRALDEIPGMEQMDVSVKQRHQHQLVYPPPYMKDPGANEELETIFATPLHNLPTLNSSGSTIMASNSSGGGKNSSSSAAASFEGNVTSNLITHVHCLMANKMPPKRWTRTFSNPIDYTPVKKKTQLGNRSLTLDPLPYCPIPSRLPFLRQIGLRIWSDAAIGNKSLVLPAILSLSAITGHRAAPVFSDRGDATKKIREGMPLGASLTLTGRDMYEFTDKLVTCVLPRLREWPGMKCLLDSTLASQEESSRGTVSNSNSHVSAKRAHASGLGNSITLTLPAAAVGYFPDIEPHFDMYPRLFDTEITFYTSAETERDVMLLLSGFGIPFVEQRAGGGDDEDDGGEGEGSSDADPWAKYKKKERKAANKAAAKKKK